MTASFEAIIPLLTPGRPVRFGNVVQATLIDKIASGELAPGTTLPTEAALCEAFGVSRTVIRESFKLLEEKGLVRVRQGQGTTVELPEQWNLR
jgi:DNA-binding FadR family transcriptional regulator